MLFQPRLISKHIVAKRTCGDEENEEPQETSSQYIFIPHSMLLKENYVKNDSMFIEIKIIPKVSFESTAL